MLALRALGLELDRLTGSMLESAARREGDAASAAAAEAGLPDSLGDWLSGSPGAVEAPAPEVADALLLLGAPPFDQQPHYGQIGGSPRSGAASTAHRRATSPLARVPAHRSPLSSQPRAAPLPASAPTPPPTALLSSTARVLAKLDALESALEGVASARSRRAGSSPLGSASSPSAATAAVSPLPALRSPLTPRQRAVAAAAAAAASGGGGGGAGFFPGFVAFEDFLPCERWS